MFNRVYTYIWETEGSNLFCLSRSKGWYRYARSGYMHNLFLESSKLCIIVAQNVQKTSNYVQVLYHGLKITVINDFLIYFVGLSR